MKFTVNQEKLSSCLQSLIGVVPTKSTFPVLTNVLIEAANNKLKLSATDLEVAAVTQIEAQVAASGSITVPAKQFFEIIKQLPPLTVEFQALDNKVTIKCEKSRFNIIGLPKDDFPKIPEINKEKSVKLPSSIIETVIKKTLFAVSTDSSRPDLCGVFFQMSGDKLKVVATDAHRLAMLETMIPPISQNSELLLSPKGLNIVNRMLPTNDTEVTLRFDDNYSQFMFEDTQVFARHIEGPYRDYEKAIPKNNKKLLTVNVDLFAAAVRRVAILSDTFTHQIRLSLKADSLDLSSQTVDIGEAKESLAAVFKGEDMEIGYNASYLLDIVKNIDSEEMVFHLNTSLSAALINPAKQAEDYSLMYLLMPIRLPE
jgi:DNA polymerase-3 subunit beta